MCGAAQQHGESPGNVATVQLFASDGCTAAGVFVHLHSMMRAEPVFPPELAEMLKINPAASTGADPTCYTPTSFTVDTRSFNRRIFD